LSISSALGILGMWRSSIERRELFISPLGVIGYQRVRALLESHFWMTPCSLYNLARRKHLTIIYALSEIVDEGVSTTCGDISHGWVFAFSVCFKYSYHLVGQMHIEPPNTPHLHITPFHFSSPLNRFQTHFKQDHGSSCSPCLDSRLLR
jgi:hypothetical protein